MASEYKRQAGPNVVIDGGVPVTPNDATPLTPSPCRALYIGVAGDLAVTGADGNDFTHVGLAAGVWHPVSATHVLSTGTTAASILAGY